MSGDEATQIRVIETPGLIDELRRARHNLLKSYFKWIDQMNELGIHAAQMVRHDHKLSTRFKEDRTGWWATRLSQKYRIFYKVRREEEVDVIEIIRFETHNKQNY